MKKELLYLKYENDRYILCSTYINRLKINKRKEVKYEYRRNNKKFEYI